MTNSRRFAIVGSCTFNNYYLFYKTLKYYLPKYATITSGRCNGTDALAEVYANQNGHALEIYEVKWDVYGKDANMRRDSDLLQNSDQVIAFWDGVSPGTKALITMANKRKTPCMIIDIVDSDTIRPHTGRTVHINKEPYDVYIGRGKGGIFGNPFPISEQCTREQVVAMFVDYLLKSPDLIKQVLTLKNKILGCYCAPNLCHGDAIHWLLDNVENELINLVSDNTPETDDQQKQPKIQYTSFEEYATIFGITGGPAPLYTKTKLQLSNNYSVLIEEYRRTYLEIADKSIIKQHIHLSLKERERLDANADEVSRIFYKTNDSSNTTVFQQQADFPDSLFKAGKWYVAAKDVTL